LWVDLVDGTELHSLVVLQNGALSEDENTYAENYSKYDMEVLSALNFASMVQQQKQKAGDAIGKLLE
jgi:hypothetical protein